MGLGSVVKKAVKKVTKTVKKVATPVAAVAGAVGLNKLFSTDTLSGALNGIGLGNGSLTSLLPSLLQYYGTNKQIDAQNMASAMQWDFARQQLANQNSLAKQNMALEKEFAQNGIRWKVEDAKAAGLHPLIGAGATTTTYSPTGSVGVGIPETGQQSSGIALSELGQNLSRAFDANRAQEEHEIDRARMMANDVLNAKETQSRIDLNNARMKQIERESSLLGQPKSKGVPLMYKRQPLKGQRDARISDNKDYQYLVGEDGVSRKYPSDKHASANQNDWGYQTFNWYAREAKRWIGTNIISKFASLYND